MREWEGWWLLCGVLDAKRARRGLIIYIVTCLLEGMIERRGFVV
jgi:hypothetical protein